MVKYKASELIALAMKISDLENTSFITSTENRAYINDAWCWLYQQAIDGGEQFYIITDEIFEGENNLPDDFHQLYDIYDSNGNKVRRYNKDLKKTDKWYRIKNDKIYLNRCDGATIEYYPEPKTLDIEGTGDIALDFPSNIYKMPMVYKLAIYYKIRQSADISGISILLNESINQFYDMLTRDDNENLVMNDVYTDETFFSSVR